VSDRLHRVKMLARRPEVVTFGHADLPLERQLAPPARRDEPLVLVVGGALSCRFVA
jgi:hypothetical protein